MSSFCRRSIQLYSCWHSGWVGREKSQIMLTSFMDGPLAQVATCSHGSARTDDHAISLHFVKPAPGGDLRSFRPKKLAAVWCMLSLIPVVFGRLDYNFDGHGTTMVLRQYVVIFFCDLCLSVLTSCYVELRRYMILIVFTQTFDRKWLVWFFFYYGFSHGKKIIIMELWSCHLNQSTHMFLWEFCKSMLTSLTRREGPFEERILRISS